MAAARSDKTPRTWPGGWLRGVLAHSTMHRITQSFTVPVLTSRFVFWFRVRFIVHGSWFLVRGSVRLKPDTTYVSTRLYVVSAFRRTRTPNQNPEPEHEPRSENA